MLESSVASPRRGRHRGQASSTRESITSFRLEFTVIRFVPRRAHHPSITVTGSSKSCGSAPGQFTKLESPRPSNCCKKMWDCPIAFESDRSRPPCDPFSRDAHKTRFVGIENDRCAAAPQTCAERPFY
ncbi:hypothetical protein EVAR_10685_1 [Eumeta japonica]|uniref:Uncharacterized protein n=1 Tax=Eumeta variegata TaxID=151549 RepID=A0A4C1U727_EUMVA|nr:hypothetical protein EVAR_10685_1 [Eumeta japonica]